MKPIVTWVVVANTRAARVYAHLGPGKGLAAVNDQNWRAPEVSMPRDKAGVGHSISGPAVSAVSQTDPQELADTRFAKRIAEDLAKARHGKTFDRLILISGPHMMGLLRAHLDGSLSAVLIGEIPKDLSAQPLREIESQLGALLAV
ncbi:host attachment protein [uncultured Tateyamaria sp.]|nr:host attachment protein [uncultured Tateyamaria sp.]